MAYAVSATVASILGIDVGDVNADLMAIGDAHLESIIGWDMDKGKDAEIEYFDVLRRNEYYVNYDGHMGFTLKRKPIIRVTDVIMDPYGAQTVLTLNDDYRVKYEDSIIIINDSVNLDVGTNMLKIRYEFGYVTLPADIVACANLLAAYYHDSNHIAKNDAGAILKEIEIGRWRELYDISGSAVNTKYKRLFGEDGMIQLMREKYGW